MEKHPSSLAVLAEIFEALAEQFPNGSCCFLIRLVENRGNWKIFDKYFCFLKPFSLQSFCIPPSLEDRVKYGCGVEGVGGRGYPLK